MKQYLEKKKIKFNILGRENWKKYRLNFLISLSPSYKLYLLLKIDFIKIIYTVIYINKWVVFFPDSGIVVVSSRF